MIHALALIAAVLSTAALLVMVSLTVFLVSLAFKVRRSESSRSTGHPETSTVGEQPPAHRRPRTRRASSPCASTDRFA